MKIKKNNLKKLIESYLNEEDTENKKVTSNQFNDEKDDFKLTSGMEEDFEEYVTAVDAYRNPEKPVGNMPHFNFGDESGVTSNTKMSNIPSDEELEHVRNYQSYQEIDPRKKEYSVDDHERTIPRFDIDKEEKTKESSLGTQYSMDDTNKLYRFDDKTISDPGNTIYSPHEDDDIILSAEDEEGYEPPDYSDKTPPRTYGINKKNNKNSFLNSIGMLRDKILGKK